MRNLWIAGAALACVIGLSAGTHAQQTAAPKRPAGDELDLTATSANVASAGMPVKIRIIRWSTDAERAPLMTALTAAPPTGPQGGERGARGAGRAAGAAPQGGRPAAAAPPPAGAAAGGPQAGRAAAGAPQAGRAAAAGRGRGALVERRPLTPIEVLTQAIEKAPTVGYIWTNDVTGYSIKYAWHAPAAGGERIVLVTDRRLGKYSIEWKPAGNAPATDYDFTVIEMHVDARGIGEAKTSLTAKVVVDADAKTLAIDNYAAAPVLMQNIRRYTPKSTE